MKKLSRKLKDLRKKTRFTIEEEKIKNNRNFE